MTNEIDEKTKKPIVKIGEFKFIEGENQPFSGKTITRRDDGSISMTRTYEDGDDHGERVCFDEEGNITSKMNWVNGVLQGNVQQFRKGKLFMEGPYRNGKQHGMFVKYRTDGSVMEELMFSNGRLSIGYRKPS